jgi:methylmalonyl-CoA epimerase
MLTLDHVGFAVENLALAAADLSLRLGVPAGAVESIAADGIEVSFLDLGPQSVELLAPTRPDSSISRFLGRRGPGLHHVAYLVDDIREELGRWQELGAQLIDREPRVGSRGRLVAFVHPATENGVLTELVQVRREPA